MAFAIKSPHFQLTYPLLLYCPFLRVLSYAVTAASASCINSRQFPSMCQNPRISLMRPHCHVSLSAHEFLPAGQRWAAALTVSLLQLTAAFPSEAFGDHLGGRNDGIHRFKMKESIPRDTDL